MAEYRRALIPALIGYDVEIRTVEEFPVCVDWSWALTQRGGRARAERMLTRRLPAYQDAPSPWPKLAAGVVLGVLVAAWLIVVWTAFQ